MLEKLNFCAFFTVEETIEEEEGKRKTREDNENVTLPNSFHKFVETKAIGKGGLDIYLAQKQFWFYNVSHNIFFHIVFTEESNYFLSYGIFPEAHIRQIYATMKL